MDLGLDGGNRVRWCTGKCFNIQKLQEGGSVGGWELPRKCVTFTLTGEMWRLLLNELNLR